MKKALIALALILVVAGSAFAQVKNGPIVDKVIFEVRMDPSVAVKDVIEGKADVYMQGVDPKVLTGLTAADKAKVDMYAVPAFSSSLLFNPIPNKAPYTWTTKSGVTEFNPLAIKEIRFAMNFLLNRKTVVDEAFQGQGDAAFTPATNGQPGAYRYNLIPAKYGISETGNEAKAIADINAAMEKAAALPENQGKLVKRGNFWQYDGKDVTIKVAIRIDMTPDARPVGHYVCDQIEKAGIKTDRMERDRSIVMKVYYGDPADYEWGIYTEGWGAGATRNVWHHIMAQMYANWYGYMPGGGDEEYWNFINPEIDRLTQDAYNGNFLTEAQYWTQSLGACELGVQESVRIYLATKMDTFIANKARFNSRMAYGLGDGINGWSIRTADVKPETAGADRGLKVLRVIQYSAAGTLFMSAWDPVGVDGFTDVYSRSIIDPVYDAATFEAPNSANVTALRTSVNARSFKWDQYIGKNDDGEDEVMGRLPVPTTAVLWDGATKTWKSVGTGVTARGMGEGQYNAGTRWHNGQEINFADVMYALAFNFDWAKKDTPDDKYYDSTFAAQIGPSLRINKGFVVGKNRLTSYVDYDWPMDKDRAQLGVGAVGVTAGGYPIPWDVVEAMALLVVEGSKSKTNYSFTASEGIDEIDAIAKVCVDDIKAKLEELAAKQWVPASIKAYTTAAQAVARYKASIDFINKYGHAFISNGPFLISKVDSITNSITLEAFRTYPYKSDYWVKAFRTEISRITNVQIPLGITRNADVTITILGESFIYPDTATRPLGNKAKVTAAIQLPDGSEAVYNARYAAPGVYQLKLAKKDLEKLQPGSYTVVIMSQFGTEMPSVVPTTLTIN